MNTEKLPLKTENKKCPDGKLTGELWAFYRAKWLRCANVNVTENTVESMPYGN